jgi:uncharacterized protein YjeT (DUF2065 family)
VTTEIAPLILAIALMVMGASCLSQTRIWAGLLRDIGEQPQKYFLAALGEVVLGLVLALGYNHWQGTWPIFTTVFGWLMVLEGTAFLLAPGLFRWFVRLSDRAIGLYLRCGGLFLLGLGALLARFAFLD